MVLDRPALSIGVGVAAGADYVARARELGIEVVRRTSGGTAVLFGEGDLVWGLVVPRGDPRAGARLSDAYDRLGAPLVTLLRRHHVPAAWVPAPALSKGCCLLGERGRVLQAREGILSGAAQHLIRGGLLHHGTLPRAVDRAMHRALFSRDDPAAFDRLVGTQDVRIPDDPESLREELDETIAAFLAEKAD